MKKVSLIILLSLVLFGCNSTSIVSSWKPDNSTTLSMRKVLVVGLMGNERELRENTERAIAQMLTQNGINAVPGIVAMGVPPANMKQNKERIDKELKDNNYDGLVIISLLNKERDIDINSPLYYGSWWGPYRYGPAYVSESVKYGVEVNIYSLNPEKLLYSVLTKNYESSNMAKLAEYFADGIQKDMQKEGLLTTPAK